MASKLLIVGAGGFGRAVAEAVEAAEEFHVLGFVDDRFPDSRTIAGKPIVGATTAFGQLKALADFIVIAIGDNKMRAALAQSAVQQGFRLASVIHPHAFVSPSVEIGPGSTVMAGSVIGCGGVIGEGAIVNYGCAIDHDCNIGAFAHLGVGACMAGGATLGPGAWLQAGSTIGRGQTMHASAST